MQCLDTHKEELPFSMLFFRILELQNTLLWIDLCVEIFSDLGSSNYLLCLSMILKMMDILFGRENCFTNNWQIANFTLIGDHIILTGFQITFGRKC